MSKSALDCLREIETRSLAILALIETGDIEGAHQALVERGALLDRLQAEDPAGEATLALARECVSLDARIASALEEARARAYEEIRDLRQPASSVVSPYRQAGSGFRVDLRG